MRRRRIARMKKRFNRVRRKSKRANRRISSFARSRGGIRL